MESIFKTGTPSRDKLLSRVFGIFNEDVIRYWAADSRSPYEDLGRPTLRDAGETRGHTLDFTLRDAQTGKVYVTEMKCELEYEGYRYLRLTGAEQVRHHVPGAAFQKILRLAENPESVPVYVGGKQVAVDGTALVWGASTIEGEEAVKSQYGFDLVLSVEKAINDLRRWKPDEWVEYVRDRQSWVSQLFDSIV